MASTPRSCATKGPWPRSTRWLRICPGRTGGLDGRLDWEVESGLYYVGVAAMTALAGRAESGERRELLVHVERGIGRVSVRVDDPAPTLDPAQLRVALTDDAERLAALGGGLEVVEPHPAGGVASGRQSLALRAWLPDRLEPVVQSGAELRADAKLRAP